MGLLLDLLLTIILYYQDGFQLLPISVKLYSSYLIFLNKTTDNGFELTIAILF